MRPRRTSWVSDIGAGARALAASLVVLALSVGWGVRAGAVSDDGANSSSGAVVSYAESAQGAVNYIMPFVTGANNSPDNTNLQWQMWPTLYTIGTRENPNKLNATLSLADAPVYSDGNKQVSVTLKPYKWSDGRPLTARDVTFFMNILKANKISWSSWAPGNMPTNVVSVTTRGSRTVIFRLNQAYNPTWFTDTQLALIVPMPQQAWDKTSARQPVGTYDTTAAGAKAVFKFLHAQGEDTATYDTNPLWQVVDGPFKLAQYTSDSFVKLVPNNAYSGPDKPHISAFEEVPYTSPDAEFNAVLAGDVQLGYVPLNDLAEASRLQSVGYHTVKSSIAGVNLLTLNYHSPVVGPLVKQLYIRQALNDVMDEPGQIKAFLHGDGAYLSYGMIPTLPRTPFIPPLQRYLEKHSPFSIAAARQLLTSHGWEIPASGAAKCERPGNGPSDCGPGIAKDRTLEFHIEYASGSAYLTQTMANYKSDAGKAGIVISLSQAPYNSVVDQICGNATCDSPTWQIDNWATTIGVNYKSPYPEGGPIWENHLGLDYPVTAKLKSLINATRTATGATTVKAMRAYETFILKNQLELWQIQPYTINAVSNKVKGVWYNAVTEGIYPQSLIVK